MSKKPETYCFCRCPICGEEFYEWIELYAPCVVSVDCWCPMCKRCVRCRILPADLHYAW